MGTNLEQVARAIQSETDIMSRLAELEKLRSILEKDNHSAKALDSLVPAISSALVSNQIAVCLAAMGAMQGFLEQVSGAENPHLCRSVLHILLPAIINRLGDSKLQIRELALEILCETWRVMQRTNFSHDHNYTLTSTASSPAKRPGLQARLGAHLSHLRTPFRNRAATTTAAAAATPAAAASPAGTTGQWYAASAFEKEIKAQGFRHRTYRVREMCVEWVVQSMETYPEFPTERYLSEIVELLGDNQETMRLTCKSALHKIYWTRPELQTELINRVRQSLPNSRSTVIEEITASGPGNFKSSYRPVVRDMGSPATDSPLRTGSRQAYRSVATSTPSTNRSTKAMPTPINNGSGIPRFGGLHASSIPRFGARSAMANPMSGGYVSHHDPPPPMRPGSRSNLYGARPASREAMMPARPASRAAAVPPPTYPTGIRSPLRNITVPASGLAAPPQPCLEKPSTPPPGVSPIQICDSKTLTREITQWSKHFEGKETDDNWSLREKAIHHYRNILWGNGSVDHTEQLVALLKGAMDDILKALHSLRTTLSTAAFDLTSDIAIRLGPNALPLSTVLLENSLKFCAQSKKITAQAAYNASCTIIKYLPFQHRTIKQLAACMAEKSPSLRQYTIGIATTLLATHRISGNERLVKESLGQLSQIIRKGLTDSSPAVRTPSRELYWLFWRRHQQEADRLMVTLDPTTRTTVMREQPKYVTQRPAKPSGSHLPAVRAPSAQGFVNHNPPYMDQHDFFRPGSSLAFVVGSPEIGTPPTSGSSQSYHHRKGSSSAIASASINSVGGKRPNPLRSVSPTRSTSPIYSTSTPASLRVPPPVSSPSSYPVVAPRSVGGVMAAAATTATSGRTSPSRSTPTSNLIAMITSNQSSASPSSGRRGSHPRRPPLPCMSGSTSETPTHSGSALRRNSGQKPSTPHLHNIESTPLASPARLSLFENVQYPDSPTEPTSESEGSKSGNGTKPLVNSPLTAPRSITFADTSDRQGENDGEDSNGAAINGIGAGSKPILDTAGTRVQAVPGAVIKRVNELKDVRSKNRQSLGILDFNKLGNFEIGDQLVDTDLIAGLSPGESIAADAVQMGDNSGGNKAVSPNVGAIAALQSPEASQEDASGVAQQGLFTSGPADGEDRSGAEVHAGQAQESDESMLPTPLSSGAITPSASPKQGPHRPAISAVASSGSGTHHTFMTPKTEAGRYWHGPMATPVPQRPRSPTVAGVLSPVPPNTQGRASQIEKYIDQLARGSSIDDNLFRGLVRFFKGESNLDRLEQADNTFMARLVASCVSFIQRPGETRDAMFVKDSCIDVLRMLVRRQAHLLTRLDQVRGLFWEMLRCRFMDSPILSGSAEDMLLDMVTHLDPKLSIDLFEDFLARSPLAAHPDLEVNGAPMSRVPTPPELDPMNVLGMANSIACVLELTSSLLGRLGSEDGLVVEAVSRLFPYVVVAFSHSRTQVRKAAIEPIFSAKQVLSIPNEEFVAALSRDSLPDDSSRPIAAGISILRPFLSRLEATHRKLILLYAQSQNR